MKKHEKNSKRWIVKLVSFTLLIAMLASSAGCIRLSADVEEDEYNPAAYTADANYHIKFGKSVSFTLTSLHNPISSTINDPTELLTESETAVELGEAVSQMVLVPRDTIEFISDRVMYSTFVTFYSEDKNQMGTITFFAYVDDASGEDKLYWDRICLVNFDGRSYGKDRAGLRPYFEIEEGSFDFSLLEEALFEAIGASYEEYLLNRDEMISLNKEDYGELFRGFKIMYPNGNMKDFDKNYRDSLDTATGSARSEYYFRIYPIIDASEPDDNGTVEEATPEPAPVDEGNRE